MPLLYKLIGLSKGILQITQLVMKIQAIMTIRKSAASQIIAIPQAGRALKNDHQNYQPIESITPYLSPSLELPQPLHNPGQQKSDQNKRSRHKKNQVRAIHRKTVA